MSYLRILSKTPLQRTDVAELGVVKRFPRVHLMPSIEEIRKITPTEIGGAIIIASGVVAPGILTLWMYAPAIVEAASAAKLILMALSFMLPYVSFNALVFGWFDNNPDPRATEEQRLYGRIQAVRRPTVI